MAFGEEYINHESTHYTNPFLLLLPYFLHIITVRKLG